MIKKNIKLKFDKTFKKSHLFDLEKILRNKFADSEVYLVGGAVRDIIIGREVKDIDIMVRKVKIKDLESELKKYGKVNLVGQRFSVLKFVLGSDQGSRNQEFDIAIPRKDFAFGTGGYKDFKVKSDPDLPVEEDLSRRDFTINAMAYNLQTGELVDPFGGLNDLEKKQIKAVGSPEKRFKEDYSRMLRAIRFAMQLGFKIEAKTFSAIKKNIKHINDKVKGERKVPYEVISNEFLKSFDADAVKTIKKYLESGAMKHLMPEIIKMKECTQPKEWHSEGDVLTHTLLALENINSKMFKKFFSEPVTLTTRVAILLHDIGKPPTKKKVDGKYVFYNHDKKGAEIAKKILERLKMSAPPEIGIDIDEIYWLIKNHLLFLHSDPEEMKKTTIEKYLFNDRFSGIAHMQLFLADASATKPKGEPADLTRFKKAMKIMKAMRSDIKAVPPKALLSGDEVMKTLKIKSGPKVGQLLELLREEQLNGRVKNKKEAQFFIKKTYQQVDRRS